jgi:hypothetical protein
MYFAGVEVSWDKKVNMDKTRQDRYIILGFLALERWQ